MSSNYESTVRQVFHEVHLPAPAALQFPEVVSRLLAAGVTRYHVNYVESVTTLYAPNENPVKIDIPKYVTPGETWSEETLKQAIRSAQSAAKGENGAYGYEQFVKDSSGKAGVTDYFACLEGKRVVYLSRLGDFHTEWFPGAKPSASN